MLTRTFLLATALVAVPLGGASMLPALSNFKVAPVYMGSSRSLVRMRTLEAVEGKEVVSPAEFAGAIPFASVDPSNHSITLNPAALQALSALPAPICVMPIAGAAYQGKSSLLNMFSHWLTQQWDTVQSAGADFSVRSRAFSPGTKGAHIRLFTGKGTTRLHHHRHRHPTSEAAAAATAVCLAHPPLV